MRPLHKNIDLLALSEKMTGKPFKAVVQEIRSGSAIRVIAVRKFFFLSSYFIILIILSLA